jgi:hypothetical protein
MAGGVNKSVFIQFLPPDKMRIPDQVGDWYEKDGVIFISVDDRLDPVSGYAVALHELVEKLHCDADGVTEKMVDEWDIEHSDAEEPGELPGAPYKKQHNRACEIEKDIVRSFKKAWSKHLRAMYGLFDA